MENWQEVIVRMRLTGGEFGSNDEFGELVRLSTRISEEIKRKELGELDGNEIGDGTVSLYAYGPSADALFEEMKKLIQDSVFTPEEARMIYGDVADPSTEEVRISLL